MGKKEEMIALDANVLTRFFVNDHPQQARQARHLIEQHSVYVSSTVLLESAWVLRSAYDRPSAIIFRLLRDFLRLPRVHCQAPEQTMLALEWYGAGMDFADALHLALAFDAVGFATFDKTLIKQAKKMTLISVVEPAKFG